MTRCTISNNQAWKEAGQSYSTTGGGIYLTGGSLASFDACTFSNNACNGGSGGAIASINAHVIVSACEFNGNSDGGANQFAIHLGHGNTDGGDINVHQTDGTLEHSVDSNAMQDYDTSDDV